MRYIISDTHYGHFSEETNRGIITFERTQFQTIQEHDNAIDKMIEDIARKIKPGDEFWHLGDFGDLSHIWIFQLLLDAGAECHYILGNHDHVDDIDIFETKFHYIHQYPVYVSNKLVFSHEPVATWDSVLNVHGHLHGSILNSPNYINASIHVANYNPITDKHIANAFSKLPKWNMRFLYEPYAKMYKFIQNKEDVVMDRNGRIDLSASRLLQRLNTEKRKSQNDIYIPYTGGLNESH